MGDCCLYVWVKMFGKMIYRSWNLYDGKVLCCDWPLRAELWLAVELSCGWLLGTELWLAVGSCRSDWWLLMLSDWLSGLGSRSSLYASESHCEHDLSEVKIYALLWIINELNFILTGIINVWGGITIVENKST